MVRCRFFNEKCFKTIHKQILQLSFKHGEHGLIAWIFLGQQLDRLTENPTICLQIKIIL